MLGVVIWTCDKTGRAIIWCSDHRELAHYEGGRAQAGAPRIEVGDLVEATLSPAHPVRRCLSLRMFEQAYMPGVAAELKGRSIAIAAA